MNVRVHARVARWTIALVNVRVDARVAGWTPVLVNMRVDARVGEYEGGRPPWCMEGWTPTLVHVRLDARVAGRTPWHILYKLARTASFSMPSCARAPDPRRKPAVDMLPVAAANKTANKEKFD